MTRDTKDPQFENEAPTRSVGVQRLVSARDLRFPLDPMWPRKTTWLQRLIARLAAKRILNGEGRTYQFGGYTGAKRLSYEMVDADKEQIAHWLLRDCGYACCTADIMKLTGHDPDRSAY